ncbi:MAG: hypothetical protein RIR36_31 [Bacteroidota bacterium]|jgi:hypothetical protein
MILAFHNFYWNKHSDKNSYFKIFFKIIVFFFKSTSIILKKMG